MNTKTPSHFPLSCFPNKNEILHGFIFTPTCSNRLSYLKKMSNNVFLHGYVKRFRQVYDKTIEATKDIYYIIGHWTSPVILLKKRGLFKTF